MPDARLGSTFKTNSTQDIFAHFSIVIFIVILPAGKSWLCKNNFLHLNKIEVRKHFIIGCFWKYTKCNTNILIIINIYFTKMQKRPMLGKTKRNKYPKKKMKIHQIVYLQIWTKSTRFYTKMFQNWVGTHIHIFFLLIFK